MVLLVHFHKPSQQTHFITTWSVRI